MAGNSFGEIFRITTWGESHGKTMGVLIDGCPPGLSISENDIQVELDRRRPGQSDVVSTRQEKDVVEILSGVFEAKTLGTPISLIIRNHDANTKDYQELKDIYRPSHADFTYEAKFGIRDWRGGGRASARETIGRVAAGSVAKKILGETCQAEIVGWVSQLGNEVSAKVDAEKVRIQDVEQNEMRCPDREAARKMFEIVNQIRAEGDTIGGVITCVARNIPAGLGEPVFDKLQADLAKGMCSLPAVRAFEIGSGFYSLGMRGSEHNDPFVIRNDEVHTAKNDSGGIQGGISNGENILVRVTFKPVSTVFKTQKSVTKDKKEVGFQARGRHDPCVLPRAVVMVEAMMALTLVDHLLRNSTLKLQPAGLQFKW